MQEKDLLESFSDRELIEDWLEDCREGFSLTYYATASALLLTRESIHLRRLEDKEEVKKADKALIEYVLKEGSQPPDSDDPEKYPLDHWWWHLDRIAERTYPADLLPEHLREIYLKAF